MQTRSFIDRLGDLDEEITKVCRAADVMSKGAGKEHSSGVGRLKEACDALQEKQKFVRDAKDCLLGLDGFMHALSGEMRQLMEHPEMGNAVSSVSQRMQGPLGAHVATIVEETVDGLRRVSAAVKALRETREDAKRAGSIKESTQALSKVCAAAENALKKALKHAESPPKTVEAPAPQSGDEEVVVEEMIEKAAHGYDLTAGLPPEFLENAQKKKDEAAGKKDEDEDEKKGGKSAHGYDLTAGEMPDFIKEKIDERDGKKDDQDEAADKDDDEKVGGKKADSLTPGNESKGPKDEGEEDDGWVPGHRTTQKPTGEKSAKGKVPDAFLENIEKMKAKGKDGDKKDDKDDDDKKKAGFHGYDLGTPTHGYDLFS